MTKIQFYSIIGGLVVVALLGVISLFATNPKLGGTTADDWNVGGNLAVTGSTTLTGNVSFSGTLNVSGEANLGSLIQGGNVTTLTGGTVTTTVMTASQICDSSVINWLGDNSFGAATATFPSETDLTNDCLTAVGDTKTILYRNTAITGSTTQLVAGTDMTIMVIDTNNSLIDGGNAALVTFIYVSASNTIAIVEEVD